MISMGLGILQPAQAHRMRLRDIESFGFHLLSSSMKQSIWTFVLIAGGFILAGTGLSSWFAITQVTQLPDWYTHTPSTTGNTQALTGADLVSPVKAQQLKTDLLQSVEDQLTRPPSDVQAGAAAEVSLTPDQVNQWIAASLAANPNLKPLHSAIEGLQTNIDQGILRTGLVVNTADLDTQKLPLSTRQAIEPILAKAPFLKQRELYIGIEGVPQLEAGQLRFDDQTKLVIGNMIVPASKLSQQFGISPDALNTTIPIRLGPLKVESAGIRDRNLVLRGTTVP